MQSDFITCVESDVNNSRPKSPTILWAYQRLLRIRIHIENDFSLTLRFFDDLIYCQGFFYYHLVTWDIYGFLFDYCRFFNFSYCLNICFGILNGGKGRGLDVIWCNRYIATQGIQSNAVVVTRPVAPDAFISLFNRNSIKVVRSFLCNSSAIKTFCAQIQIYVSLLMNGEF